MPVVYRFEKEKAEIQYGWLVKQGFHHVHCRDLSVVGIKKLNLFAIENTVHNFLTTEVPDLSTYTFDDAWDGVVSIWFLCCANNSIPTLSELLSAEEYF